MNVGKFVKLISKWEPISLDQVSATFTIGNRNPEAASMFTFLMDLKAPNNTYFTADWGDCRNPSNHEEPIEVQTYVSDGFTTHISATVWLSGQTTLTLSGNAVEQMSFLSAINNYTLDANISTLSKLDKMYMRCTNLSALNAHNCKELTSAYFYGTGQDLYTSGQMLSLDLTGTSKLNNLTYYAISNPVGNLPASAPALTGLTIVYDNTYLPHSIQTLDLKRFTSIQSAYIEELSTLQVFKCTGSDTIKNLYLKGNRSFQSVSISGNNNLEMLRVIGFWYDYNPTHTYSLTVKDNPNLNYLEADYLSLTGGFVLQNCNSLSSLELMWNLYTNLELSGLHVPCAQWKIAYNTYLEEIVIKDCPYLKKLDCSNNANLKKFVLDGCLSSDCNLDLSYNTSLKHVVLRNNALNSSRLNTVIDKLVAKAPSGGILDLRGNLSGYLPSATKVANLEAKGWSVLTGAFVDYIRFEAASPESTIALVGNGNAPSVSLEYTTNERDWQSYTVDTPITLEKYDEVLFRGNNVAFASTESNFNRFELTGYFKGSGNLMSLYDTTLEAKDFTQPWAAGKLFYTQSGLLSAPSLPVTGLTERCYSLMFTRCENLQKAPELPAMTMDVASYWGMFWNCSGLIEFPELPATTLATNCYRSMFYNCVNASNDVYLPATELVSGCYYQLFRGCSSFKKITIMGENIAGASMVTMLYNAEQVNDITVHFSAWGTNSDTDNWMSGTKGLGVFTCPSALPKIRDLSHIRSNWTVQTF